ncbi:MAG: LamG domain-containing protein [Candidatus Aenigmarchaeota archaeon]|nr:LamG domain-containing protein [Candidatus Aenigmarchaeota archaeon]
MKAISTVIASILMLMITIALGGTTYLYVSGVFTGKTATSFEIIDSINDTVTIRNSGTEPITTFSSATLDGSSAVYRVSTQDSALIAYWRFDEGFGSTVQDSSGSGNSGTITGAGWRGGKFGSALDTTGSSQYAERDWPDFTVTTLTIEFWMNPDIVFGAIDGCIGNCYRDIVGIYGHDDRTRFHLEHVDNSIIWYGVYGAGNLDSNVIPTVGQWYHVVGTNDGTTARVYVNGELKNSGNRGASDTARSLVAGTDSEIFDGMIDEVKIYTRTLTEQEVRASYNIGGQINPGQIATMKVYGLSTKGTHTLRLCTSSICNTAYLTIN